MATTVCIPSTSKEDAIDDLMAALDHPSFFRTLVDALGEGPVATCLRLWGIRHGYYSPTPLAPPDVTHLKTLVARARSSPAFAGGGR
jgi:hypothetical protein